MLKDFNPTTRRYPRTLDQAFPQNAHDWIEEPTSTITTWDVCVIAVAICIWVAVVYWWSVQ